MTKRLGGYDITPYLWYSLNNYIMKNYSKLKDIVKYYEKNQEVVLEKYHSYLYDLTNSEADTSNVEPQSYISYIIGQYSIDTYFKSYVKKGKGDYPTGDLMKWVRSNFRTLEMEYNNGDLNYRPIDMLKFILNEYNDLNKLETFIETI